eukprot:CAMPEP_0178406926 /NCGR_PEP_ID=MMETSP0689_2-20121128/19162_1 /TAXON_ID=160604 /ORGANISM="Amphidinium massartii, Strain CS-259" /LENGTH=147 /DNA_ID=CAMNT_0020027979 /DNA_START=76 /DNA_END=519 /DNA_ORIENTATION=+
MKPATSVPAAAFSGPPTKASTSWGMHTPIFTFPMSSPAPASELASARSANIEYGTLCVTLYIGPNEACHAREPALPRTAGDTIRTNAKSALLHIQTVSLVITLRRKGSKMADAHDSTADAIRPPDAQCKAFSYLRPPSLPPSTSTAT